ncbi:hypothetical protein NITGR_160041 [Nitrospina gracilis 3/211]|uniref:DUF3784 domain-containing protein n=2 Tax=Nitrospinaceae TaxID=407032 RepID=M1YWR4_NITG3|nr:hypothetical protein NITGR_160041 [Nitrospina gracilis 3/211]
MFLWIALFLAATVILYKACKRDNLNPWLYLPGLKWGKSPSLTRKERILISLYLSLSLISASFFPVEEVTWAIIENRVMFFLILFAVCYFIAFSTHNFKERRSSDEEN